MELENAYHGWVTDQPLVWTMVVVNGTRKVIQNDQNAGPTKLWATEQLIYRLLAKAKWGITAGSTNAYGEIARAVSLQTATIDWTKSRTEEEIASTNHGITEVGIEAAYHGWWTDQAKVWTMAVANGKRKVVSNYQNAGPTKLWAIEQLIDALLAKAEWDPTPNMDAKK